MLARLYGWTSGKYENRILALGQQAGQPLWLENMEARTEENMNT